MLNNFKIDFGLCGEWRLRDCFWSVYYSMVLFGKSQENSDPSYFWYLSLAGAVMTLIYALVRSDLVFLMTGFLQIILYSRNLVLAKKKND